VAGPGRQVLSLGGRGVTVRANDMRIFKEIHLSIVIAICAFAIGKAIWSALAAVW
jgi:hypothetical protein